MLPGRRPRRPAAAGGRCMPRETPASRIRPAALRIPVPGSDPRSRSRQPAGPHADSLRHVARRRRAPTGSVEKGAVTGRDRERVALRHVTVTFTLRLPVFSPSVADSSITYAPGALNFARVGPVAASENVTFPGPLLFFQTLLTFLPPPHPSPST